MKLSSFAATCAFRHDVGVGAVALRAVAEALDADEVMGRFHDAASPSGGDALNLDFSPEYIFGGHAELAVALVVLLVLRRLFSLALYNSFLRSLRSAETLLRSLDVEDDASNVRFAGLTPPVR